MPNATRDAETYQIIGAAMDAHRILGHGFLESVYRAALKLELRRRSIPARAEVLFHEYKGEMLPVLFKPDLVCFDRIIVEAKATAGLGSVDFAQAINYLRVSSLKTALLLNFGTTSLEYKRVVL